MTSGSTGESSAWPYPYADAVPDLRETLSRWLLVADDMDEFALALNVASAIEDRTAQDRDLEARAVLSTGDPGGALRVLEDDGAPLPALGASITNSQLLVAAARGALGDDAARAWLLRTGASLADTRAGWLVANLVGLMHDYRGDRPAADAAWRLLPDRYSIMTSAITGRLVEAHVASRAAADGGSLAQVSRTYSEGAFALEQLQHTLDTDPRPALAAADGLVRRGDVGGARVLLEMLRCRGRVPDALRARLAELTPGDAMRRHAWMTAAALLAVPLVALLVPGGIFLAIAGGFLWQRYVRIPGLSRKDSQVWRATRRVRYDPETGRVTDGHPDGGWIGVAGIMGFIVGLVIAGIVTHDVVPGSPFELSIWLIGALGVPALAVVVTDRLFRSFRRRTGLRRRATQTRRLVQSVGPCQCWNAERLLDEVADAYSTRHLVDWDAALHPAPTVVVGGTAAHVRQCPELGVPWILATLDLSGARVLLRGALPGPADDEPTAETGLYL